MRQEGFLILPKKSPKIPELPGKSSIFAFYTVLVEKIISAENINLKSLSDLKKPLKVKRFSWQLTNKFNLSAYTLLKRNEMDKNDLKRSHFQNYKFRTVYINKMY